MEKITIKNKLNVVFMMLAMFFVLSSECLPLPEMEAIISGTADFQYLDATTLQINASDKAIINYRSFDIGANESVIVSVPLATSEILNRVTGDYASRILGSLSCNGRFFLINEKGILFGSNANVDVGSIVASTRDIANSDFLSGKYVFQKLSQDVMDSLLINKGTIQVRNGGFGVMIAGGIKNEGIIAAPLGTVALAAGDMVTLGIAGEGLISVGIDQATASTILGEDGQPITSQITNTGALSADGGMVLIRAESLNSIFKSAVNLEGYVNADTVEVKDGVIRLVSSGDININANLSAGKIEISAPGEAIAENVEIRGGVLRATKSGVTILAKNDISINADVTSENSDINIFADYDGNGVGEFSQSGGTIYAQGIGNVNIDGSGTMNLSGQIAVDQGYIKVGEQRTPELIIGNPHYIHYQGDFQVIEKQEENGTVVLKTSREDTLRYAQAGSLILESPNGRVIDATATSFQAGNLSLIAQGFIINTYTPVLSLNKTQGDIYISDARHTGDLIAIEGEDIQVSYLSTASVTLIANGAIGTKEGVILSAKNLNLSANKFGSAINAIQLEAENVYIKRLSGEIQILESIGLGESILIRGPPDGFGAIIYPQAASLTLEAEKTRVVSRTAINFYGNITFYNFACDVPDLEIYFEAGKNYTFKGSLAIVGAKDIGAEEYYIKLRSQTPGKAWNLLIETDDYLLERVNISDCNAQNLVIIPIGVDAGNNYNLEIDPVWDGGGIGNNWSTPDNWDGNAVPTGAEAVTFNSSSSKDCTIDNVGIWSGGVLTITSDYSGTITQAVDIVTAGFSQAGGVYNSGTCALTVNGNFTLSAGTFTVTSGTLLVTGTFNSDGTFNAGTSTITFEPSDNDFEFFPGTSNYYNVTVDANGKFSYLREELIVTNNFIFKSVPDWGGFGGFGVTITTKNFTWQSGYIINSPITIKVSGDLNATTSIFSGYWGSPLGTTFEFNGTGNSTFIPGTLTHGNITINKDNQTDVVSLSTNNLTLTGGSALTITKGIFDLAGRNLNIGAASTFSNNGTLALTGDETLTNVTMDVDSGLVKYTATSGTRDLKDFGATDYYNLEIDGTGGTFTLGAGLKVANNLTLTNGTLNLNGQNLDIGTLVNNSTLVLTGDETVTITTMDVDSGLVKYIATGGARNLKDFGATDYYNLEIDGIGGTFTLGASLKVANNFTLTNGTLDGGTAAIDIDNNVSLSGGTLTATSGSFTVGGNWVNTGAVFTSGANTVTFDGVGTQTINAGGIGNDNKDFNNVVFTSTTLQLSGSGLEIDGTLTINSGKTVDLNSQPLTLATLANDGTLSLSGDEAVSITTMDVDSGLVKYTATSGTRNLKDFGATDYYNLEIDGIGGTFTLGAGLKVANNFTLTNGTLNGGTAVIDIDNNISLAGGILTATSGSFTVGGNWMNTGAVFASGINTVIFDGATTQTINAGGINDDNKDFYNLTVSGSTLKLSSTSLEITGTLIINSGKTLDQNGQNLNYGTLVNNGTLISNVANITEAQVETVTREVITENSFQEIQQSQVTTSPAIISNPINTVMSMAVDLIAELATPAVAEAAPTVVESTQPVAESQEVQPQAQQQPETTQPAAETPVSSAQTEETETAQPAAENQEAAQEEKEPETAPAATENEETQQKSEETESAPATAENKESQEQAKPEAAADKNKEEQEQGFNMNIVFESPDQKYKKPYESGNYKTVVVVFEGKVSMAEYDDKGANLEKETILLPGDSQAFEAKIE